MSHQTGTEKREDVGKLTQELIDGWNYDGNCEVLLYCNNGKWSITVDRQFYSLGLKKDDPETYLQKAIKDQNELINKLTNQIENIKKILAQEE
jgi:hypothetical protein